MWAVLNRNYHDLPEFIGLRMTALKQSNHHAVNL